MIKIADVQSVGLPSVTPIGSAAQQQRTAKAVTEQPAAEVIPAKAPVSMLEETRANYAAPAQEGQKKVAAGDYSLDRPSAVGDKASDNNHVLRGAALLGIPTAIAAYLKSGSDPELRKSRLKRLAYALSLGAVAGGVGAGGGAVIGALGADSGIGALTKSLNRLTDYNRGIVINKLSPAVRVKTYN